jgi:hypothetical protein
MRSLLISQVTENGLSPGWGRGKFACWFVAPGGWLLVMGEGFGRLGRRQPLFNHGQILQRNRVNYS